MSPKKKPKRSTATEDADETGTATEPATPSAEDSRNQQAGARRDATEHRLCPVCYEELMLHQAAFLQCAHAVCTECFAELRSRQRRFPCPVCRDLPSPSLRPARGITRARVIVCIEDHWHILLIRDFSQRWVLPGGHIEDADRVFVRSSQTGSVVWPSQVAARRELFEETGLYANVTDLHHIADVDGQAYFKWVITGWRGEWEQILRRFHCRRDTHESKDLWVGEWRWAANWSGLRDSTSYVIQLCASSCGWWC